jgi:hypothetical protein
MTSVRADQNRERGKADERDIARRLGGVRHPANTGGPEDISHSKLAIQVKGGKNVTTKVIRDGMASAEVAGSASGKLPTLVLVDRSASRLKRYIVFDLDRWIEWQSSSVT